MRPVINGWIGEKVVAALLLRLPKDKYCVLNDVMIQTERRTSQIDHLIVSVFGIFVVELKNYKGWITGSEYGEKWTQNIYGHKSEFYNPLRQNFGHVKALASVFGIREDLMLPVVVFAGTATIKVKSKQPVIYVGSLVKWIRSHTEELIDADEMNRIAGEISAAKISGISARIEHVGEIHQKVTARGRQAEEGICPLCGGKLVRRSGKYGDFWGCSNYPKCRYVRKDS